MRLSKVFILLFVCWSISMQAQQKASVKVYGLPLNTLKVMVEKHPKYFKHLKNKWLKAPEKMSQDELMLTYYGSTFLSDYQPQKEDKASERIAKMMGELDFKNAIIEGEKLLTVYPLNSRLYLLLGYAYKKNNQLQKSKFYYKKYADLLRVPLYSGSGKNFENAFVVRSISDEYLILNQNNLELVQQELRYHNQMPFDVLLIKPQSKENKRAKVLPKEKTYFNVYLPFFVGQHKTYKMVQDDAKKKYKMSIKGKSSKAKDYKK